MEWFNPDVAYDKHSVSMQMHTCSLLAVDDPMLKAMFPRVLPCFHAVQHQP